MLSLSKHWAGFFSSLLDRPPSYSYFRLPGISVGKHGSITIG